MGMLGERLQRTGVTIAPPDSRHGRLVRLGTRAWRVWRRDGSRAFVRKASLALLRRLSGEAGSPGTGTSVAAGSEPPEHALRDVPALCQLTEPSGAPSAVAPVDPAVLAAIECVARPLDKVDGGIVETVLADAEISDVVKAYFWRLCEAMPGMEHRRVLPRARVAARLDLLKRDPLALVILYHLCSFRNVDVELAAVATADEAGGPPPVLVIADPAIGRCTVSGDGAETLTFRWPDTGITIRRNLGAALRERSFEFLAPASGPRRAAHPSFSVVIPVYDRTTELLEAIGSVLNQDYPWCELVLVFNGSPSETLRLVPKIRRLTKARRYREQVIVLPRAYGAGTVPRNIGGFASTGDVIVFLDSDDRLEVPAFLSRAAERVQSAEDRCCLFYPATVEFVNIDRDHWIQGRRVAARPPLCDWDVLYTQGSVLNNSGVGIRRDRFLEIEGLNPAMEYCEDYELHMRAVGKTRYGLPVDARVRITLHSRNNEIRFEADKLAWMLRAQQSAEAFTEARESRRP